MPTDLSTAPKAKEGDVAPGFTNIPDWSKWMGQVGLHPYIDQLGALASQTNTSREDAAYRHYYGLPATGLGYGQSAANFNGAPLGAEGQAVAQQQNLQAVKPAIQSLQASLPEISQKFATTKSQVEGEIPLLKQKYDQLIAELKGKETKQVGAAELAASQEFGRRGIPASSTAYSDYLANKVNPITSDFAGLINEATLGQTQGIKGLEDIIGGLAPQEVEAQRAIQNMIANLQAGAGKDAIAQAMQMLQLKTADEQFKAQQGLAQQQFDFSKSQAEKQQKASDISQNFASLSEGQTLFNLLTGQSIFTAPKTDKQSSSLSSQFGGSGW